jgi:hypothetical protein
MGHFTITLPDGRLGDVRYGTVRTKSSIFSFFLGNKAKKETKTGYVVRIGNDKSPQEECWLYRSTDGKWSQDVEGQKELDNDMYLSIRNAINEKDLSGQ